MTRERTAKVIPITAAVAAVRDDGNLLDFESITDEDREAWRRRRDAEVARERARGERAAELEGRKRALLAAGFPLRAVECALTLQGSAGRSGGPRGGGGGGDDEGASIAFMRSWDPSDRCIVVLSGTNGVGKTVAATWWAMRAPVAPMFVRASTYARAPRYGAEDAESKARWIGAPALVFDDAGAEFLDGKGSLQVDLDELIDTFYGAKRTLVITTNIPSKGTPPSKSAPGVPSFRERYGARVADRIGECGHFFEDDGPSRRGA